MTVSIIRNIDITHEEAYTYDNEDDSNDDENADAKGNAHTSNEILPDTMTGILASLCTQQQSCL